MFSWPSLLERMCRTWGSNSGLLACQANSLPIELPRPVDPCCDYYTLFSRTFQQNYDPWLILELCLCSISCEIMVDLIKSGRYIDILLCQNMRNNKNKHSSGVSCSASKAFIWRYFLLVIQSFLEVTCWIVFSIFWAWNNFWATEEDRHNCMFFQHLYYGNHIFSMAGIVKLYIIGNTGNQNIL